VQYGRDHVLGEEFNLPAELWVRRTMLVEINPDSINLPDNLKICLEKPAAECLSVPVGNHLKPIEKDIYGNPRQLKSVW